MIPIEGLLLVASLLVLFAIASSKFSTRVGLPALVIFLVLGMLAGSEGIGGIHFENYGLANGIGTVALALILFDGGLRTSLTAFRLAWKPALTLATAGVLITSAITGLAAAWLVGFPILVGILLGSIVGSTDAAAVFAVLRGKGTALDERLSSTLEVESGSNDPMAIFLTVGLLGVILGDVEPGLPLLGMFMLQMSVGGLAGVLVGWLGVQVNNRINLDAAGLYPILMGTVGFLAFGLAGTLGGSGFLSVYIAGIVLGNSSIVFKRGILLFSDGMAWLAQIAMFTVLGLLSFPTRLLAVAGPGLLIAAILILVARPVAVYGLLPLFGFNVRQTTLVAWVGLRGAVPIILATYPLLSGLPEGRQIFDIVFFVVLVSAITQGWSLSWVARRLGLEQPAPVQPPLALEITSLRSVEGDIVDYTVVEGSRADGRLVRELNLPDGAVVAMLARGNEIIAPRGATRCRTGDHAFLVVKPDVRRLVDRVFAPAGEVPEPLPAVEFPLSAGMRVADLEEFYGITVEAPPDCTLAELMALRAEGQTDEGTAVQLGNVVLTIRERSGDEVEWIGLRILTQEE